MGTKNEGDRCYDAALPDEPMFVLLARDPSAPTLVRTWAAQRRLDIDKGRRPGSDEHQCAEADALADRMEKWRRDADEAWRKQPQLAFPPVSDGRTMDTFGVDYHVDFALDTNALDGQHLARREGDEYVCSRCNKRWDANEDAPETCA